MEETIIILGIQRQRDKDAATVHKKLTISEDKHTYKLFIFFHINNLNAIQVLFKNP